MMKVSRRDILVGAGALAATAASGSPMAQSFAFDSNQHYSDAVIGSPVVSELLERVNLETVGIDDFKSHVGSAFDLQSADKKATLNLTEVHSGRNTRKNGESEFSLLFSAPPGTDFPQDTYNVTHGKLGEMNVFLVPVGLCNPGNAAKYEAVFC